MLDNEQFQIIDNWRFVSRSRLYAHRLCYGKFLSKSLALWIWVNLEGQHEFRTVLVSEQSDSDGRGFVVFFLAFGFVRFVPSAIVTYGIVCDQNFYALEHA